MSFSEIVSLLLLQMLKQHQSRESLYWRINFVVFIVYQKDGYQDSRLIRNHNEGCKLPCHSRTIN